MDLNFKDFGEGPPVIILHGFLGMLDNWQTFGRMLGDSGYHVYLVDQRNHGRSPHSEEFSYELLVQDISEWMRSEDITSAHFIGHSMGGKTAMQFALTQPGQTESLVVVDIAPRAYMPGHQAILNALVSVDLQAVENRSEVEDALKYRLEDESVVHFLLKNLSRTRKNGYQWKMNLPALVDNYHEIIRSIDDGEAFEGPTLFVRGERSDYILDDDILDILDLFPRAQLVTIPGAGHWVHADNPGDLLKTVVDFLDI